MQEVVFFKALPLFFAVLYCLRLVALIFFGGYVPFSGTEVPAASY